LFTQSDNSKSIQENWATVGVDVQSINYTITVSVTGPNASITLIPAYLTIAHVANACDMFVFQIGSDGAIV